MSSLLQHALGLVNCPCPLNPQPLQATHDAQPEGFLLIMCVPCQLHWNNLHTRTSQVKAWFVALGAGWGVQGGGQG